MSGEEYDPSLYTEQWFEDCPDCNASGYDYDEDTICATCEGNCVVEHGCDLG